MFWHSPVAHAYGRAMSLWYSILAGRVPSEFTNAGLKNVCHEFSIAYPYRAGEVILVPNPG
eukprot:7610211-Karenia_brevis.AAC.1